MPIVKHLKKQWKYFFKIFLNQLHFKVSSDYFTPEKHAYFVFADVK